MLCDPAELRRACAGVTAALAGQALTVGVCIELGLQLLRTALDNLDQDARAEVVASLSPSLSEAVNAPPIILAAVNFNIPPDQDGKRKASAVH